STPRARVAPSCVAPPAAPPRFGGIDGGDALRGPAVTPVLPGADAPPAGLGPIPPRPTPANPYEPQLRNRDGSPHFVAPHPPLPSDGRVRLVGEAVAMVIAETPAAARARPGAAPAARGARPRRTGPRRAHPPRARPVGGAT